MAKRIEFTDKQKAEVFVRDRATCAFSGKILWILDYGACPTWDVDWVDHIKPFAKGGTSTIDNAICASSFHNYKKSDNTLDQYYLFYHGKPTKHLFYQYEVIPKTIAENLKRFRNLHYSDWYFNRALFRLLLAVVWLRNKALSRKLNKRDANYYSKSAFKAVREWRSIIEKENVLSFEERGLVPQNPCKGINLMLSIRESRSTEEVLNIVHALAPIYTANSLAMETLSQAIDSGKQIDFKDFDWREDVSPRVIEMIKENLELLS